MDANTLGAMQVSFIGAEDKRKMDPCGWGNVGLTKRELFALMIMQGYITSGRVVTNPVIPAVAFADALLEELAKNKP